MRRHPFTEISIDSHQFNSQADPHQETKENNPFSAILQRHNQRKDAIPRQREHKGQAASKSVRQRREQTGADKQPHKGRGSEGRLIGNTKYPIFPGMENTLGEQAGADITGLEQVVEFEKAA